MKNPVIFIAGRPKTALSFWFTVNFRYGALFLWLFTLYINIKVGKIVVKCYSDFYVSKIIHLRARNLQRKPYNLVSKEPRQSKGRGLVVREVVEAPPPPPPSSNFIADRPRAALLLFFFVSLDVACCYLLVKIDVKC